MNTVQETPKGGDDAILAGLEVREATKAEESAIIEVAKELSEDERAEKSQFNKLFAATEDYSFFSNDGRAYVSPGSGAAISLSSKRAEQYIRLAYFERFETAPSSENVRKFLDIRMAQVCRYGPDRPVFRRCGEHNGKLYYDLCNDGKVVVTTAEGWKIETEPAEVFFCRSGSENEKLPVPEPGGNVMLLGKLLNLPEKSLKLLVGTMVNALRPGRPYPICVFEGEAGSAKTSAAKVVKFCLDPCKELVRRLPGSERDFAVYAHNSHLLAVDNVDRITAGQSDLLCCVSTGAGISSRTHYSMDEETVLSLHRPVIITGIQGLIERADAADRTILFQFEPIPERKKLAEDKIWPLADKLRPQILGGLFDALAAGLASLNKVRLSRLPRLADFAIFATAAESGLPWSQGEVLRAFYDCQKDQFHQAIEKDRVAMAVVNFMERESSFGRREWTGTASELLGELIPPFGVEGRWPTKPATLGIRVAKAAPLLRERNIAIRKRKSDGRQLLVITLSGNPTLPALPTLNGLAERSGQGGVEGEAQGGASGQGIPESVTGETSGQGLERDLPCEDPTITGLGPERVDRVSPAGENLSAEEEASGVRRVV